MNSAAEIRQSLHQARTSLQQEFERHAQPRRLLHNHASQVDKHLCAAWKLLAMPEGMALVAVGGYGRGELYPKSDVDLLILLPHDLHPEVLEGVFQPRLQELVSLLWDIGLEVGHSTRTVAQCVAEAADVTVQTNLLEARLIVGAAPLFEAMRSALTHHLDHRAFYLAKQNEQTQRHARFLETDYNLEPNLKESPGGLRDLQTVLWISRACKMGNDWRDLAEAGMITPSESRVIARHETVLQTLRIRLHYLAKRREDRILFDYQTELAEQMRIAATRNRRASEHLMQRYYRTKKAVLQLNAVLLQNMRAHLFPEGRTTRAVNENFIARDDLLEARTEDLFELHPSAILESFLLLQQHPGLAGFSAATSRALWRSHHKIDGAFRRDPHNREMFMTILRQPQGVVHALRRMNQYGTLGSYIPAFGRIVGQMQHDLFHVYTVDEHILMVVRNLRRFAVPEYTHEFPLCSALLNEFARPEVLYISGLFHDIAKGRGGDHSQMGKQDARRFCTQHQLSRDDSDLVVWLVEQHLTLSATAQKQDLSDPEVIANFAKKIKNERYLVALYLLTVADVRGTSPKVWNAWKAKLIEDLFHATRRYLGAGLNTDRLDEIRKQAVATLNLYALAADTYQLLWAQLEDSYFLDHEAQEIAWHTRLLAFKVNIASAIVKARLSRAGEGLQVMVYCPDQRGLFARICDFFARMNFTIVEAKIHTTRHGYALNSFQIMEAVRGKTAYRDIMNYIEFELAQQITQAKPIAPAASGRVNRQLKHFPISTEVDIKPERKGVYVLSLIAGDRPGLLARIALIMDQHLIRLHRAKINTLGSRAEDVFWISGAILDDPEKSSAFVGELETLGELEKP